MKIDEHKQAFSNIEHPLHIGSESWNPYYRTWWSLSQRYDVMKYIYVKKKLNIYIKIHLVLRQYSSFEIQIVLS